MPAPRQHLAVQRMRERARHPFRRQPRARAPGRALRQQGRHFVGEGDHLCDHAHARAQCLARRCHRARGVGHQVRRQPLHRAAHRRGHCAGSDRGAATTSSRSAPSMSSAATKHSRGLSNRSRNVSIERPASSAMCGALISSYGSRSARLHALQQALALGARCRFAALRQFALPMGSPRPPARPAASVRAGQLSRARPPAGAPAECP